MDAAEEFSKVPRNFATDSVSIDELQVSPKNATKQDPSIEPNPLKKPPVDIATNLGKAGELAGGATRGSVKNVAKLSFAQRTGSKFTQSEKGSFHIRTATSSDPRASLGPSPKASDVKHLSKSKRRTSKITRPVAIRSERETRECGCVPFGVILAISLLGAAGHMVTQRVRAAEALNPGLAYMFKLVDRDDWCGHFEHGYQPPAFHGYYSLMTNLTALVVAERHFSSRGNIEISLYPEIVEFDAEEGEDAVFILCFTIPIMMMLVEANSSTMWVKTLRQPCASTPDFYDYLEDEIKRAVPDGASFQDVIVKGYPLRFAIVVNVSKSEAMFKVCRLLDDECIDSVGSVSQQLKYVSLEKGVKKFALVSNGFAPGLRFHCRISESKLPLCWAPGTTVPRLCPL